MPMKRHWASKKLERQISSGHRWVPTGKLLNSCTGKVENEPTYGSNVDIPHIHACKQTLGLSCRTEYQLADMFTKALPEDRFKYLVRRIGMRCLTPAELEVLTNETA
ncbi:hypothetical protein Tco_0381876 [Tanacetum coccineum]